MPEVLGQVRAPADHRRHRAQPAAGGAPCLCPGIIDVAEVLMPACTMTSPGQHRTAATSSIRRELHTTGGRENGVIPQLGRPARVRLAAPGSGAARHQSGADVRRRLVGLFRRRARACGPQEEVRSGRDWRSTPRSISIWMDGEVLPQRPPRHLDCRVEREVAQSLVEEADRICPYSKAIRGNIEVTIRVI